MATKQKINKIVVLDAGHGGTDPGAYPNGLHLEKDKALKITLAVGARLLAQGVDVRYTRTTDTFISLTQRTNFENAQKAACCVSLHLDSAPRATEACGMSVWLHSNAPAAYVSWAKSTLAELQRVGYETNRYKEVNKGYRTNPALNYAWNQYTNSPSMLLELGFLTNADNLRDFEAKYQEYAIAVAKAICTFIGVKYQESVKPPDTLYRAQCGAFSQLAGAQKLKDELASKGYQTIITNEDFYRVQVGAFSIYANAQKLSLELKRKGYPNIIKVV